MGFKFYRERKKFTQDDVAEVLGIDRSSVAKWETGKVLPRGLLMLRVAELYGCTVDDLLRAEPQERIETPEQTVLAGAETPEGTNLF